MVITNQPGYTITWDGNNGGFSSPEAGAGPTNNIALASNGTTAFGSSEYGHNFHMIAHINDGFYGNSASWISDFSIPDRNPYIGLNFGKSVGITNIAWGRDNGDDTEKTPPGPYTDRSLGTYILQVTTVANPGTATAETDTSSTGWLTIGSVTYKPGTDNISFSAYLRHRCDISANGNPIQATGLRIKVSDPNICIDEIEVDAPPDPTPPTSTFITITNSPGYTIDWNGNNGQFYTTNSPAPAPQNRALASEGTTAFASSEYGHGVHFAKNVIDGLYGNTHSWISDFTKPDTNAYVGLNFNGTVNIKALAWGRDNGDNTDCCGGQLQDRWQGTYTLQVSQVANPGPGTAETGDSTTGWSTVGTLTYKAAGAPFAPYLRHLYTVSQAGAPIAATGLRIKVSDGNIDIDEIEVNPNSALQALADGLILLTPQSGYTLKWDGNDGDFYSPDAGAGPPDNAALASKGVTPFGSSELDFGGLHLISHINDGLYGNSHSWISDRGVGGGTDTNLFVGLNFGKTISITNFAWGRDNGDTTEAACGGTCMDRSLDTYSIQVTTVANPGLDTSDTGNASTGWATLATITYRAQDSAFHPWLRHRFDVAAVDGAPVSATGFRIKVSDGNTDIDEIEVNTQVPVVVLRPLLTISRQGNQVSITWTGTGTLQSADQITGPWQAVTGASSPYPTSPAATQKFYRVQQ